MTSGGKTAREFVEQSIPREDVRTVETSACGSSCGVQSREPPSPGAIDHPPMFIGGETTDAEGCSDLHSQRSFGWVTPVADSMERSVWPTTDHPREVAGRGSPLPRRPTQ